MNYRKFITGAIIAFCSLLVETGAQTSSSLTPRQRAITEIASLTAKSELETLSNTLDSALDSAD